MDRRRLALSVAGLAVAGSQAGHLLAYDLRFGAAAQQLQAAGAHAYFPALAKTSVGVASLALLAGLLAVGAARIASGRRLERAAAPSFVRLLAALYTFQLACFAAQETAEALAGAGHPLSAPLLILWGAAGQLPVAIVAALALGWLLARLGPAVAVLRLRLDAVYRRAAVALTFAAVPLATDLALSWDVMASDPWRGPPFSL